MLPFFYKGSEHMNWGDIKRQTINLGFTKQKDFNKNPNAFYDAANWAMRQIALNVNPIIKRYTITHRALTNLIGEDAREIKVYEGTPLVYKANNAKGYYFECDGNGTATISDNNGNTTVTMAGNHEFKAYKGLCNGSVTITFSGGYAYAVRNVSAYGILYSNNVDGIPPYSEYISYDFKTIDPMFLGFALEKPVNEDGLSCGYRIVSDYKREEQSVIKLSRDEQGQFLVWYKAYPTPITGDTADDYVIELPDVAADIVPYLMAYRLFLDDDIQTAIIYQNASEDLMNKLMGNNEQERMLPAFVDVEGREWLR